MGRQRGRRRRLHRRGACWRSGRCWSPPICSARRWPGRTWESSSGSSTTSRWRCSGRAPSAPPPATAAPPADAADRASSSSSSPFLVVSSSGRLARCCDFCGLGRFFFPLMAFVFAARSLSRRSRSEMLASGGIHISNGEQYALSDVIDAIKCAFGASPQIVCKKGSVEELRLCFDKDLKPRDCLAATATNGNLLKKKHCPRYIALPTYDPLVLANSTREIMTEVESEVYGYLYTS